MSIGNYQIFAYDPAWAERFADEKRNLMLSLGSNGERIEHIGSTAVPGLGAKPIVDLMLGVDHRPSMTASATVLKVLENLGYTCKGYETIPGTLYCPKPVPCRCNLHLTEYNGPFWQDYLLFRDYLCAHPAAVREYEVLKRNILAALGPDPDRDIYNQRKEAFILTTLQKARATTLG